ncbi:toxin-antitoxin system TumE family protein [Spirosoma montaniterrae]|uniref:Uncharacterized protein n=1 Tax=Spirosoma montaniterrae TaxID=1178516 RepID=A0A1P9X0F6_9BACT|nr:DUF6516 family protein [Spirosoma montaniterrae]AQG81114.1 hypothetical protein AWR27_18375 [Spirosoma montaniterrae]
MNEAVEPFSSFIRLSRFAIEQAGPKRIERCELVFIDDTRLVGYESRMGAKFKYTYQWMNSDNQTLCRWDNTPHFPQFNTYPFHRHVGIDETAEPFANVSLADVVAFVTQQIAIS